MKYRSSAIRLVILFGLFVCGYCASARAQAIDPNFYELRDTLGGVQIVFDSHLASPLLTYKVNGRTQTFRGADITVESSSIGKLVSVTTRFTPDVNFVTLSFMIPELKIPIDKISLGFASVAIVTNHLTPFVLPPVTGVLQLYSTPVVLRGVAKAVP